jgi:hypothetical protein
MIRVVIRYIRMQQLPLPFGPGARRVECVAMMNFLLAWT